MTHGSPKFIALALILTLVLVSLGAMCNKSGTSATKEQAIAFARDIANGIQSALPIVTRLNANAGKVLATALPIANSVITAVEQGKPGQVADLLEQLIPVIDATVAQFSNNVTVLGFLALADIGIHFLINHANEIFGVKAIAKASSVNGPPSAVAEYAGRAVWGCQYHPEKCKV